MSDPEIGGTGTQNPVLLNMGGNSDGTVQHFKHALSRLSLCGFKVLKTSEIFSSKAVGCEPGAADFFNLAVLGEWQGTPEELLNLCQKIEVEEGRPANHPHWHSRTLDIDLILLGNLKINTPRLTVPHPLAHTRGFVIQPSLEIAPRAWLKAMGLVD